MDKKSGFTLIELLIVMLIIGVISTFALKTISQNDKVVRYIYSNVYHNLDKALYNSYYLTKLKNPFLRKDINESGVEVTISEQERVKRLCLMLTEYINYSQINCSAAPVTTSRGFTNPHFTSMNGVKFYISPMYPNADNAEHYFFLVFADMNGAKEPNSMVYNPPTTDPDIFAFAALDIARFCPLGPPEVDTRFMQTRVTYFDAEESLTKFSTVSKAYYISKAEAWGYYLSGGGVNETFYIESNPLTYNGYLKNLIRTKTNFYNDIYGFLNGANLRAPNDVGLKNKSVNNGGYGCVLGSDTECDVIIDKYVY